MDLYRFLRAILRSRWDDARVDPPFYAFDDYCWMAARLFRQTGRPRFGDPRVIALELSITVICMAVIGCYGEVYEGSTILYSPRGGERDWGLRIYHGLAHWILEHFYHGEYSEADAWLLTIELACCGPYLLEVGAEQLLLEQRYCPEWLPRLYLAEIEDCAYRQRRLPVRLEMVGGAAVHPDLVAQLAPRLQGPARRRHLARHAG